ncbi:MAG: ATP-binding protein [Vulcanimicrobiota bacterium]
MEIKCPSCLRIHRLEVDGEVPLIKCACSYSISNEEMLRTAPCCDVPHPGSELNGTIAVKKELSALIEISKLLVSTFDKDTLLSDILNITAEVMDVEACSIILYDKERDDMAFYMSKGPGQEEITQIRLAKGEGIAGWVFLNKKSVISEDTAKDERFSRKVDDSVQYTSKNLMCVPVFVGNEIIGVMESVNKKGGAPFNTTDLPLFESMANHVGEAIEKARLMAENIKSMRLATIGQTLSSLSHCIKNILNGLSGGAFLVNKALNDKNMELAGNGWDIVDKCIARITDLTMNMLAYSKERIPLYQNVNPNKIASEIAHLLSKRMEEQGITLSLELEKDLKDISIDSYGIFRCLLNLVTNAIEACPRENGAISLRTRAAECNKVIFEVHDNGTGISDDQKDKIFSVFFSTKGGQGTGLGLAVTQKIIEEHRGRIWLESGPEKGTTFFIELPSKLEGSAVSL